MRINHSRRSVTQRLVKPRLIVKMQVAAQSSACSARAVVVVEVDLFIFDAAPQTLCENVVKSAASAVHADAYISGKQTLDVLRTGEVAALIAVAYLWRCDFQRSIHRSQHKGHFQGLIQFPTDDVARIPVQHRHQINPASRQAHVGNVYTPDGVGSLWLDPA